MGVQIFIDREDDCFGMYTFLQRLNTQIQNDESQSIKVHAQIAKYTEELEESKKTNHRLLADVEAKRDTLLQKVHNSKKTLDDFQENLNLWGIALEKFLGQSVKSSETARSIVKENYPELLNQIENVSKSLAQRPITPKRVGTPDTARKKSPLIKSLQPKPSDVINDKNMLQTLSLVEMMATEIVEAYSASGLDKSLKKLYKFGLPAPPHPRRSGSAHKMVTRMEIPSFDNWFDNDDERAPARPYSTDMLRRSVSRGSPHLKGGGLTGLLMTTPTKETSSGKIGRNGSGPNTR